MAALLLLTFCGVTHAQNSATKAADQVMDRAVWLSPEAPQGIWDAGLNDPWPVKMIVQDLKKVGVNTILFMDQDGRGGQFFHPTNIVHTNGDPMDGRDFL